MIWPSGILCAVPWLGFGPEAFGLASGLFLIDLYPKTSLRYLPKGLDHDYKDP